jgi:hypothetical protein
MVLLEKGKAMQKAIVQGLAIIVIGAAAYFTGAVTDVGGALDIALDEEQRIAYCEKIVTGEIGGDEATEE